MNFTEKVLDFANKLLYYSVKCYKIKEADHASTIIRRYNNHGS